MTTPTHSPTETVSDPTYLFHPDNHLLDKKPTESDKDMEWTTNPPTEPTVEKWEEILKKAEKYVRANSVYYGNDQYRLSMTDWLYFIKGVANEVEAHSVQEAKAERDRYWLKRMNNFERINKKREDILMGWSWIKTQIEQSLASLKQEEEK